jgi:hypothetical protein
LSAATPVDAVTMTVFPFFLLSAMNSWVSQDFQVPASPVKNVDSPDSRMSLASAWFIRRLVKRNMIIFMKPKHHLSKSIWDSIETFY